MPFTPLHMGPGILIKSVLKGSFSLMVFGWTQILMDIQPLIVILSGEGHIHGFSHTWLGALVIGITAALTGKHFSQFGLRILEIPIPGVIDWSVCFISAFIGSFSHILLDSLMHTDMQPLFPFNDSNILLGVISVYSLHIFCLLSGMFGTLFYFTILLWKKRK